MPDHLEKGCISGAPDVSVQSQIEFLIPGRVDIAHAWTHVRRSALPAFYCWGFYSPRLLKKNMFYYEKTLLHFIFIFFAFICRRSVPTCLRARACIVCHLPLYSSPCRGSVGTEDFDVSYLSVLVSHLCPICLPTCVYTGGFLGTGFRISFRQRLNHADFSTNCSGLTTQHFA